MKRLPLQLDLFGDTITPVDPAPSAKGSALRKMQVQGQYLHYRLLRSKRRTIGFLIDEEGLRVTAPKWVTLADIEQAIHTKQRWIFAKLSESRSRLARQMRPVIEWHDGARLPYLGRDIVLRLQSVGGAGVHFDAERQELALTLPPQAEAMQIRDSVLAWLQQQARHLFNERLTYFAERMGVRFHAFSLTSARTRWGSCTTAGKIRLNWRLIHLSAPLIDYVVTHELAHLKEMNHGPRFWETVQTVLPEFEIARAQLRKDAALNLPEL